MLLFGNRFIKEVVNIFVPASLEDFADNVEKCNWPIIGDNCFITFLFIGVIWPVFNFFGNFLKRLTFLKNKFRVTLSGAASCLKKTGGIPSWPLDLEISKFARIAFVFVTETLKFVSKFPVEHTPSMF